MSAVSGPPPDGVVVAVVVVATGGQAEAEGQDAGRGAAPASVFLMRTAVFLSYRCSCRLLGGDRPGGSCLTFGRSRDPQLTGQDEDGGAHEHHVVAERRRCGPRAPRRADRHGPLADACGRRPRSSGPSSSSSGPLSTSSWRLRVPTTGARATPSCSPTSASTSVRSAPAASRARRRGTASIVSRQPVREQAQRVAVGVDHDVADLAGAPTVAVQQGALEHQPGTDTGADPEHHQAAVAGVAEGVLAEDGGVGVVRHEDREVERRRAGWRPAGCPCQPRLGASTTVPAASTTPGLPTPMPSTGRSVIAISSAASWWTSATASSPSAPSSGELAAVLDLAGEVEHGAGHPVRRRRGRCRRCGGSRRPGRPASAACRPGSRPGRRAPRPGPRRPARRPGRRRSPGSARWCGPGRRGWPGRRGRAAGAAATGGGDGCPPGGAGPGPQRPAHRREVVVTFVS